ncbi:MAG: ATP-binding protein [Vulcanimicrobiota bacterium]
MSQTAFLDIVGNREARQWLERSSQQGNPYPSLLFSGPAGLGKRLTAIWYAAFLNCAGQQRPCGRCPSCGKIARGNHPDLLVQERLEKKNTLGVGEIREGIAAADYTPYEGGFRIWIIPEAERLTEEAQNSLLKTLEEPPRKLVVILVTSNLGVILPTVASRCQPLRFRPVETTEVESVLLARGCEAERAGQMAALAEGRVGQALQLLEQPLLWEQRESILELLSRLPGQDLWGAIETAQEFEGMRTDREDRSNLERVLETTRSFYRDLLVVAAGAPAQMTINAHHHQALVETAGKLGRAGALVALERLAEAEEQMQQNVSPRLLLQRLCLRLAKGN